MSVASNINKNVYTANGSQTSWPYTFPIIDATDIHLYVTDLSSNQVEITTNFTVDTAGQTVTYPSVISGLSPVTSGYTVAVVRVNPLTQLLNLLTRGNFSAANIELALDKLTFIAQQHDETLSRCIQFLITQTPSATDITALLAAAPQAAASAAAAAISATNAALYVGTIRQAIVSVKTADYTLLAADVAKLMIMNSAAAHTFTLPAITGNEIYILKNIGTGLTTITPNGAQTTEKANLTQGESVILVGDLTNTKWRAIATWMDLSAMTRPINFSKGSNIADSATPDLGAAGGNCVDVDGTTTITSFGTVQAGTLRWVRFTGARSITYNATSMILPGGASITTAANDCSLWESLGSGNWICHAYTKADGTPVVGSGVTGSFKNLKIDSASNTTFTVSADELVTDDGAKMSSLSLTVNCATTGAAGLDAGSLGNNQNWYVFAVRKPDGTKSAIASQSATAPTMPSGYTGKALIGGFLTDGSAHIIGFRQEGKEYLYKASQLAYDASPGAGAWVSVDLTKLIPASLSTKGDFVLGSGTSQASMMTNDNSVSVAVNGIAPNRVSQVAVAGYNNQVFCRFSIITANTVYVCGSAAVDVYVAGFTLNKL